MINIKYEKESEILKALAHPVRLQIIAGLLKDECNVSKIQDTLNVPQSTISQHLGILKSKGIIKGRREGITVCYKVIDKRISKLMEILGTNNQ